MIRLFIAIPLPEQLKQQLITLRQPLENVRWQPMHQMHITLRFLGNTSEDKAQALAERLRKISMEAFRLKISGMGCFPGQGRPKVLWAGVEQGHALITLQSEIEQMCRAEGFSAEEREYVPHITLAKVEGKNSQAVQHYLEEHRNRVEAVLSVNQFVLYESLQTQGGVEHAVMENFGLV